MQVTVFGASGHVGRLVVQELVARGHTVVAVSHRRPVGEAESIQMVSGDVHDAASVAQAIKGSQAVISCLGSWGTPTKDILTALAASLRSVAPTDQRLITLTGTSAFMASDQPSLVDKLGRRVFMLLLGKVVTDAEEHLRLLADSSLAWTAVRSPAMTGGSSDKYRFIEGIAPPWASIPRRAVAYGLVDAALQPKYLRQAVSIIR